MKRTLKNSENSGPKKESPLTKALDDLNNTIKSNTEKSRIIAEEHFSRIKKFNMDFNLLANSLIRPIMAEIIKELKSSGHNARFSNKNEEANFRMRTIGDNYISYYFHIKNVPPFILLFRGNSPIQKVFIEFHKLNEKPTVHQFDLKDISRDLIDNQLTNEIKKINVQIKS